jgi:hypothetical protein
MPPVGFIGAPMAAPITSFVNSDAWQTKDAL